MDLINHKSLFKLFGKKYCVCFKIAQLLFPSLSVTITIGMKTITCVPWQDSVLVLDVCDLHGSNQRVWVDELTGCGTWSENGIFPSLYPYEHVSWQLH